MGRYYFSQKTTVESTRKLDVNWLIREGKCQKNHYYWNRIITWTTSGAWGESKNRIGYDLKLLENSGEMKLSYVVTDPHTEEKEDKDYTVELVTTPCHFGNIRWWFICPGRGCGRRVGCLYFGSKLFLCRHCLDLTYESRNTSSRYRSFGKFFDYENKADKIGEVIYGKHGRKFYRGEPTKKYLRYLNLNQKSTLAAQIVLKTHGHII